jgi:tetratricopeptide (TPR) repeat protein
VDPEGRPLEGGRTAAVEAGERTRYRMERVGPGLLPEEPEVDPLRRAQDLCTEGDRSSAREVLERALAVDLRFLDGHGLLGALELDIFPPLAVRRCEMGVRIGELSIPADLDGVLPFSLDGNRPFLRCLHGFGQGLWRVGRAEEAAVHLERLLRLDPADELGARVLLADVRQGKVWERPRR